MNLNAIKQVNINYIFLIFNNCLVYIFNYFYKQELLILLNISVYKKHWLDLSDKYVFVLFSHLLWVCFFLFNIDDFFFYLTFLFFFKQIFFFFDFINFLLLFLYELNYTIINFFSIFNYINLNFLSNPQIDLDLTVNTDMEDLLAFLGDSLEFIEQDKSFFFDASFDSWWTSNLITSVATIEVYLLYKLKKQIVPVSLVKFFNI